MSPRVSEELCCRRLVFLHYGVCEFNAKVFCNRLVCASSLLSDRKPHSGLMNCAVHLPPNGVNVNDPHLAAASPALDDQIPKPCNDDQIPKHDRVSLLNLIKSCQKEKNLWKLSNIHAHLLNENLVAKDTFITTALITTYADCGALEKACEVLSQTPAPNVVFWNALISGYVRNGFCKEALECFQHMREDGICPNAITYISVLKACGITGYLDLGQALAAEVNKQGLLNKNIALGTAMVDMYFRCFAVEKAREVFEHLPMQNVFSWTALISGYVQHGLGAEALKCFRQMREAGIHPNAITFISVLKACGIVRCLVIGEEVDAEVRRQGLLRNNSVVLGNALVSMYAKCGVIHKAAGVFEKLPIRNVASWNALIVGYAQNGLNKEALKSFRQMKDAGIRPNVITYLCILKVCGSVRSLEIGSDIDVKIRKEGLLKEDLLLGNALVDMYSKCGALPKAKEVFELLPVQNIASWNALITGYAQNGCGDLVLNSFRHMQDASVSPDAVTFTCILKACGIVKSLGIGEDIHAEIRKQGLLQNDVVLGTALVDMYSKCGELEKAIKVFEHLPVRNVVSWSAMITAYTQNGLGYEALKCFKQMQDLGVCPNAVTYASILKACGNMGCLMIGEDLDREVRMQHLLEKDIVLGTALVDMYSKCGALEKAKEVFEELPMRNVVTWSALGAGYAQLGQANTVFLLHRRMRDEGIMPDVVSLLVLLTACSHAGLVKEAEKLFDEVCIVCSVTPILEHYTCMIDLYGRAGHFHKVKMLLDKVWPSSDCLLLFLTVLGACKKWRNVELGRWAFEQALRLDGKCPVAYICMQNIYVADEMQIEVEELDSDE